MKYLGAVAGGVGPARFALEWAGPRLTGPACGLKLSFVTAGGEPDPLVGAAVWAAAGLIASADDPNNAIFTKRATTPDWSRHPAR